MVLPPHGRNVAGLIALIAMASVADAARTDKLEAGANVRQESISPVSTSPGPPLDLSQNWTKDGGLDPQFNDYEVTVAGSVPDAGNTSLDIDHRHRGNGGGNQGAFPVVAHAVAVPPLTVSATDPAATSTSAELRFRFWYKHQTPIEVAQSDAVDTADTDASFELRGSINHVGLNTDLVESGVWTLYETNWITIPLDQGFNFMPSWALETNINVSFVDNSNFSHVATSAEVTWDPQPFDIRGVEGDFANGDYSINTNPLGFSNNSFTNSRVPEPGAFGLMGIGALVPLRRRSP